MSPSVKPLKTFTLIITLFLSLPTIAQKLPGHAAQVVAGYGLHGSGDMDGVVFGAEYIKYYSKKFSLNYNFRASIHSDRDEIFVTWPNADRPVDASVRFTTAGVQLGVNAGYSFVRNSNHEVGSSFGPFLRYQSASNGSDGYTMYLPIVTGFPVPLLHYDNRSPQHTFSLGAIFQLHYKYTFHNKTFIGFNPGFQTDTNGDVMPQLALSIGRRF